MHWNGITKRLPSHPSVNALPMYRPQDGVKEERCDPATVVKTAEQKLLSRTVRTQTHQRLFLDVVNSLMWSNLSSLPLRCIRVRLPARIGGRLMSDSSSKNDAKAPKQLDGDSEHVSSGRREFLKVSGAAGATLLGARIAQASAHDKTDHHDNGQHKARGQ